MTSAPIVRVELLGGMGNQLFQAAAGFALAKRLGAALEFDISRFRDQGARSYALDNLAHGARIAGNDLSPLARAQHRIIRTLTPKALRRPPGWRGVVFREASYAYDPRFEHLSGRVCLSGYFHSARYFDPVAAEVRRAFDLAQIASEKARAFARTLPPHALAVHARIGDFKDEAFSATHGTLAARYYRDAIALARAARPVEEIFLFTDTPDAAQAMIPDDVSYRLVKGFSAADDLFLMSSAAHHIIANSTFSWWSAWMAPQLGSLVIAPRAWLTPQALKKTYIGDLYPEGWVML
ncbi:MAG: alpha-1,2-fucosyltransferase [Proteobacteria bacterium]|nr:alpha-1,2-fucosyltransferase [Pseudomonadota bacterium]